MEQQDKYIRFDWAVKRLLRQKANFGVLEGFLTVLLGENVKIIEILESESNQQTIDDKFNRVDIKARNKALSKTYTVSSNAVEVGGFHVACVVTAHHLCRMIVCHYVDDIQWFLLRRLLFD